MDGLSLAWKAALDAASALAPQVPWRRHLALRVKEASGAVLASVATCPPGYWFRFQHDTVPEQFDSLIHHISAEFLARIDQTGEGWRFAVEQHGIVYAPLDTAINRGLAEEIYRTVLAPVGIAGWIVAFVLSKEGLLLGMVVVGTAEPSAQVLPRIGGPLEELALRMAHTLETSLDLAQGCGVVVPQLDDTTPGLTARERQIADFVVQAYSNANIGAILGISPDTVAVHLRRIYRKLGVHSRVELGAALQRRRPGA